jgi:two-component system chemotaxis sensor kinase CheA
MLRDATTSLADTRAALHTLKGSAAMAGHTELALVVGQLGQRVREGGSAAREGAAVVLEEVLARLQAGGPPFATRWPIPPPPLGPTRVDPRYALEYQATMRDRLLEIDRLLAAGDDAEATLVSAGRALHAMKGAAAAVGDDVTAWYCHGLEACLKGDGQASRAQDRLMALSRDRLLVALLVDDGEAGLETLRAITGARAPHHSLRGASKRPQGPAGRAPDADDLALRVSPAVLDQLVDHVDGVNALGDDLDAAATAASRMSARLFAVRATVLDALRRIGPARPWGPPRAALAELEGAADTLRRAGTRANLAAITFRGGAGVVRTRLREVRRELTTLRLTSMGWLFERVGNAALRFAEQQGKLVHVAIAGAEVPVDRALADRLFDAVLQLVKNAVAHGIEAPERRVARGKPERGTLLLRAERDGDWLRVQVEDDGPGVDAERVQKAALARGLTRAEVFAQAASDDELMGLLLLPGMTTTDDPDLLAGRGLGLELVQAAARQLGGAVRLHHRGGGGLVATLEVPSDQSVVDVLWLEERGATFAVPVGYAGRVAGVASPAPPRLSACLGERGSGSPRLALHLIVPQVGEVPVGIDRAGAIERVGLRPLPARVAAAGPFAGAVLRPDGTLVLVLDGPALAASARVLTAMARAGASPA